MDQTIAVPFANLDHSAETVRGLVNRILQQVDQLQVAFVQAQGVWESKASGAYAVLQTNWHQTYTDISQTLNNFESKVHMANQNYQQTENAAYNTLSVR